MTWVQAAIGLGLAVFAIWGYLAPGVELRREGTLTPRTLAATYWAGIVSIPWALWVSMREDLHPANWYGPGLGEIVLTVVPLVFAGISIWTAQPLPAVVSALVGIGFGLHLVEGTRAASPTAKSNGAGRSG